MVTEIIQERRSGSKSNLISKGVRRDNEPSRLPRKKILNFFSKSKAIRRYVRSRIVLSLPHSHWKRFYRLITVIILKPDCIEVNQLQSLVHKVQCCILLLVVFIFSTRTAKHKKTCEVSVIFHDEFVRVVQCYLIKYKKRNHKYFVSRAKLLTTGDIELNAGPVTQGNNPNHLN